jgi:hypothetical protein
VTLPEARLVAGVITYPVMIIILRVVARRRSHALRPLLDTDGVLWVSLCRVSEAGHSLDGGRGRRGGGPRGTLVASADVLRWLPDKGEVRRGDKPMAWPLDAVQLVSRRRKCDISGLRVTRIHLRLPEGPVVFVLFGQVGMAPASLATAGTGSKSRQ